jgi:hypothetical protein
VFFSTYGVISRPQKQHYHSLEIAVKHRKKTDNDKLKGGVKQNQKRTKVPIREREREPALSPSDSGDDFGELVLVWRDEDGDDDAE